MTKSKIKRLGRRLALITGLIGLMATVGASAASAEVIVNPNSGLAFSTNVSVTGTEIPAGTTDVTIVVCNTTTVPGKKCDLEGSGTFGFDSVGNYESGISIPVRRGPWTNYDFTTGSPFPSGGSTTCFSEELKAGSPCAVVVSFYEIFENEEEEVVINHLDADLAPITFK